MYWDITNGVQVDEDDLADIVSDNKLLGSAFPEDDNGDIDLNAFELLGAASLEDIKADDVVYVYENGDEEIGRVAVGAAVVTGAVTKVSKDQLDVTIDGTVYNYSAAQLSNNGVDETEANTTFLAVDDEIEAYLDAYGYIYDYTLTAGSADKYAVVLKTGSTGGIDNTLQIKLFLNEHSSFFLVPC